MLKITDAVTIKDKKFKRGNKPTSKPFWHVIFIDGSCGNFQADEQGELLTDKDGNLIRTRGRPPSNKNKLNYLAKTNLKNPRSIKQSGSNKSSKGFKETEVIFPNGTIYHGIKSSETRKACLKRISKLYAHFLKEKKYLKIECGDYDSQRINLYEKITEDLVLWLENRENKSLIFVRVFQRKANKFKLPYVKGFDIIAIDKQGRAVDGTRIQVKGASSSAPSTFGKGEYDFCCFVDFQKEMVILKYIK